MKTKVLNLLKNNSNSYISGEKISESLNVTRSAIWKHMNSLKKEGYIINSSTKNGYKLISCPDILTYSEIENYLSTKYIGRRVIYYNSIDSTNNKAKELANIGEEQGTIVISEEQTKGRGRLGRNWCSPKNKGIWMSLILRPSINPIDIPFITQIAAACVFKALKSFNINTKIKWPNDVLLNNKKLCGILTEMNGELNIINHLILGIGININVNKEDFPSEIKNIATSLKSEFNKTFSRQKILCEILNNFEYFYDEFINKGETKEVIDICKKNSIILNKEIFFTYKNKILTAKAIDIDDRGILIVEYPDGKISPLLSSEISLHKNIL